MHGLVGSLFDPSEEEDVPLLYFHSFYSCFKWLCSWMIPGLGMFSEAYFIFSIGNIKPLLQKQFPNCWSKPYTVCFGACVLQLFGPNAHMQLQVLVYKDVSKSNPAG